MNGKMKGTSTRNKKKLSVSICSTVQVFPTMPLGMYSDAEIDACWYSDTEYKKISRGCLKVIRKVQKGKIIDDSKHSARGLENLIPETDNTRDLCRADAWVAVLTEQHRQIKKGIRDPARIARFYRSAGAKQCQIEACYRGERDAASVHSSHSRKVTQAAKAAWVLVVLAHSTALFWRSSNELVFERTKILFHL